MDIQNLRCEYRQNPEGLDVTKPRLSWTLVSSRRGDYQLAYQVLAASDEKLLRTNHADLWDSGRIDSTQSFHIVYQGSPLTSRQRVFWKVKVWDSDGKPSSWSSVGRWTMGLLDPTDWRARWITDDRTFTPPGTNAGPLHTRGAVQFRKEFSVEKPIRKATVYVTGLGLYELRLNGDRVGDHLLAPEWTSYSKRIQYQASDVTKLLRRGRNAIGASVGEGWYLGRLMGIPGNAYGNDQRFLLQLEIEHTDGSKNTVFTDDSWRSTTDGPIRASGIYDGETYDARRDEPGWDKAGFAHATWRTVRPVEPGPGRLVWQPNEPIRVMQELKPIRLAEPKPGVFVFDFGQNMVGWCRLRVNEPAGTTLTLRHAEMINDDGTVYTANLRGAPQIDRFTTRGGGTEIFEPHFTYHGFRYLEITGLTQRPKLDSAVGRVFYSSSPPAGLFECSNPSLNQLMRNILWTERANLMSSPNDCPQRDERFGWMGDIQAFAQTGMFNFDLAAFFTKWVPDIRDDQADDGRFPDFAPHPGNPNAAFCGAPAWADAGVIVPWRAFLNYGDQRLLADHFDAARRWVEYIRQLNPDLIWLKGRNNDYNDWLNGDWIRQKDWPAKGASVPNEVFATAFFAHSAELVAQMAGVLGKSDEQRRYAELAAAIKQAFNQKFVDADARILGDTQGGYALALNFNLLPEKLRPSVARHLVENIHKYGDHLSTGIQTTHRAMLELTRYGYQDLAWQILTNRTFPSWFYMIDNGATTIWERWDGYVKGRGFQDAGMNSFNHWAFGAVGEWIWRNVGGLNPDETAPGYAHFSIRPRRCPGVTWSKVKFDSIRGPIAIDWRVKKGKFYLTLQVPPSSSATVYLPTREPEQVRENGRLASSVPGIQFRGVADDGSAIYDVPSGKYFFSATSPF
jgi:alpha-L-rhamnosidase